MFIHFKEEKKLKKLNRILFAGVSSILLVSIMASCGDNTSKSTTGGSESLKTTADAGATSSDASGTDDTTEKNETGEMIEMDMFCVSAPHIIDWATNDFTLYMEEKTNIKWNFIQASDEAAPEKINLLLNSGDYPDVFMTQVPDIAQYGIKEQILIPLDDLIPENMPNYWSYMQENPAYWNQQRQTDGHMYSLASVNICYHCRYFNKLWVNMDYIDEIGLGVPETTEEFKEVCQKFLELYPDGIPVTGSTTGWGEQFYNFLMGSFFTNPGGYSKDYLLTTPDGTVITAANQDEYREFLRYMNDLYESGLLYDGGFTQNPDQFRSLVNQPDSPCLFVASGAIITYIDADLNPDLYKAFRVIAPLKGPDGTQICTEFKYNDIQENKFVITDKCKYPEEALRWADQFYTLEGSLKSNFGANLDGTDWELNPVGEVGLDGKAALYKLLNGYSTEPQNHDWQNYGLQFGTEENRFGEATDADVDITLATGLEKLLLIETKEKCEPYAQNPDTQFDVLPQIKMTAEESDAIQTISFELEKYIIENLVAFINGHKDVESDWDAYISGFDNIGLPQYLEVYQTAWDRQQGK